MVFVSSASKGRIHGDLYFYCLCFQTEELARLAKNFIFRFFRLFLDQNDKRNKLFSIRRIGEDGKKFRSPIF